MHVSHQYLRRHVLIVAASTFRPRTSRNLPSAYLGAGEAAASASDLRAGEYIPLDTACHHPFQRNHRRPPGASEASELTDLPTRRAATRPKPRLVALEWPRRLA